MVDAAVVNSAKSSIASATSWPVNLPSGIVAGNLLVFVIQLTSTVVIVQATPTGWTRLLQDTGNSYTAVYYKVATGSEGATVTLTSHSTATSAAAIAWQISGQGSNVPEGIVNTHSSSTTPAADGNFTPSWGVSANTLMLAAIGLIGAIAVTAQPAGYTVDQNNSGSAPGSEGASKLFTGGVQPTTGSWTLASAAITKTMQVAIKGLSLVSPSKMLQMFR